MFNLTEKWGPRALALTAWDHCPHYTSCSKHELIYIMLLAELTRSGRIVTPYDTRAAAMWGIFVGELCAVCTQGLQIGEKFGRFHYCHHTFSGALRPMFGS